MGSLTHMQAINRTFARTGSIHEMQVIITSCKQIKTWGQITQTAKRFLGQHNQTRPPLSIPFQTKGNIPSHLTFPPQYWHSVPCHPSKQTQVSFLHTPFPLQVMVSPHLAFANVQLVPSTRIVLHVMCNAILSFRRYFDLNRNKNICRTSNISTPPFSTRQ